MSVIVQKMCYFTKPRLASNLLKISILHINKLKIFYCLKSNNSNILLHKYLLFKKIRSLEREGKYEGVYRQTVGRGNVENKMKNLQ